MIAKTPKPPYYAVIFTSIKDGENDEYNAMTDKMFKLAQEQDGFLGMESANEKIGISVSYWKDVDSIKKWKENESHLGAQQMGKNSWYSSFKVRIVQVVRDYDFTK